MSRLSFENFGRLTKDMSFTALAGRYAFQQESERRILFDIIKKLKLTPSDDLLEIGCGAGNILIPLSFFVHSATGIDNSTLLKILKGRLKNSPIQCIPGNFLDIKISEHFSKIIIYSVLHYLSDEREMLFFIHKALKLLAPGGILLLGDIPNIDSKKRFFASSYGKIFEKKWQAMKRTVKFDRLFSNLDNDRKTVTIGNSLISKIVKKYTTKGFYAKSMKQSSGLPFFHTREDILITKKHAESFAKEK